MSRLAPVRSLIVGLILLAVMPSPLAAQYVGRAPPLPAAPQPGVIENPADALARNVRMLARSPRDFFSLVAAGRAALDLGDTEAAIGFFGRAEEIQPGAPQPKVGLGAVMVQMSDPAGAMRYFNQASRLGATPASMALDRGMARDLLGDLGGAQSDYRLVLAGPQGDEARRRLALSLAIARDRQAALDAIQPLLNRRDIGAQRVRAFVLALTGDRVGAGQAIEAVMPGAGARFDPFFRYLPNLSVTEKAAAVHLGLFPEDASTRVSQATPAPQPTQPAPRPAFTTTARAVPPPAAPVQQAPVQIARRDPVVLAPVSASPSFNLPSASSAVPTATIQAPADQTVTAPAATASAPAFSIIDLPSTGEPRLSGIDKLLATIAEAPTPPAKSVPTKAEKAAAAKKVADKKAQDEKLAAEKKAKAEAEKIGVAGTHWVQLAGGSNQDRMATEYKRLAAKAGSVLRRPGYVTEGKDYFRLLVGPFASKGEAQAFVNKLAKEGVDGFSWTRTPTQIRIEKLPSK